jgi:hypothetical protein
MTIVILVNLLALNDGSKGIANLTQGHICQMCDVHTRDIPVPSCIPGNNDMPALLCSLPSRRGDTYVSLGKVSIQYAVGLRNVPL